MANVACITDITELNSPKPDYMSSRLQSGSFPSKFKLFDVIVFTVPVP